MLVRVSVGVAVEGLFVLLGASVIVELGLTIGLGEAIIRALGVAVRYGFADLQATKIARQDTTARR